MPQPRGAGLNPVPGREALLDDGREGRDLRRPADGVVLLEAVEQLLEHIVELLRGRAPPHDCVAEPQQTLYTTTTVRVNNGPS